MSDWTTVTADQVTPGDRIRYRGAEFTVARIDDAFLGRPEMLCFIEDTPDRWAAYPGPRTGEVEVSR
jgi:hypothetical protein